MIARYAAADVNVICLVGERGREVQEFIERDLGEDGLARSVVVCATSDRPALERIKAVLVATTIAEHFRDRGADVLLMCDSVTRLAWAQREVGLAVGEPPATRGFPPSVWAMLPQVLERAGAARTGSITGLYTVLVEGDDMNEPVADAVRAILDGHVVLDRHLAHRNHYPAIDVLQSVSRLQNALLDEPVREAGGALRETLSGYRDKEDMISLGQYPRGTNPQIDYAIDKMGQMDEFLRQRTEEPTEASIADQMLIDMMADRPQPTGASDVDLHLDAGPDIGHGAVAIPKLDL
jgi:flagellum-specific ATP synthase